MKEENNIRYKIISLFGIIFFTGMALLYIIEQRLADSVGKELQIASNIGEIERLDEVLTMSTKMYTTSKDEAYKKRYTVHAEKLDNLISDTFKLIDDQKAINYLHKTDTANSNLVKIELQALNLCEQGLCNKGYELLRQKIYSDFKHDYSEGMREALLYLRSSSKSRTQNIKRLFLLSVVFLTLISMAFIYSWFIQYKKHKQREALVVTVSTVLDTFGNTLNNLVLYRMKMEESADFSEDELREFDDIIYGAKEKLRAIANMSSFKSKKSSGVVVLDYQTDSGDK